jgi:hypothetical protein
MALTWAALASGVVTSQARIRFRQLEKDFATWSVWTGST